MASEFALMKAAQAWQTKSTCDLPMQPELAVAFADILYACMVNPSEATQAQLGAPVEDRKVSASDPVSASDQIREAQVAPEMNSENNGINERSIGVLGQQGNGAQQSPTKLDTGTEP